MRKRVSALSGLTEGASGQAVADPAIYGRVSGQNTTQRKTAAEIADQAAFDRTVLPGLGQTNRGPLSAGPSAATILANREARLQKDPYALDYNSDYSGSTMNADGSGKNPAPNVPKASNEAARPSGLAVNVTGTSRVLDEAGSRVIPSTPLAEVASYKPSPATFAQATPTNVYDTNLPTPGPAPTPGPTPVPTPTPVPAPATPTPTPGPTPGGDPYLTSGKNLASGVSNSQAAGFTQPTSDKPIPETPTSPALNVEDLDKRGRKLFGGF